jgi:hypothetical protein
MAFGSSMRHYSLAQPHLRPQYFVKLLQSADRSRPALRQPAWLAPLLDRLCDCIEPMRGEARVGYDLNFNEPHWQIDLFLGRTEYVGGSLDGRFDYVSFTADIPRILKLFAAVERCEWLALPSSLDAMLSDADSGLIIEGIWEGEQVRVALRSVPPIHSAPGLRQYPDGRYERV